MSASTTRVNAVVFLPCATAPLSIIGSFLLLTTIYRTRCMLTTTNPVEQQIQRQPQQLGRRPSRRVELQRLKTHHRLFILISVFDIISSIAAALGPLPIPKSTGFTGAHGNRVSCTAQGFFQTVGLASFACSSMLMVHYVLLIRFNISDHVMEKRVEPFLVAIPVVFALGVAVAGLVLGVFNPAGPFACWVSVWPVGCTRNPNSECSRGGSDGQEAEFFRDYFIVIPLIVWAFCSMTMLLVLALTVLIRQRQNLRFVFRGGAETNLRSSVASLSSANRNNTQQVITQVLLYGFVFSNTLIWRITRTLFDWADEEFYFFGKHYWVTILSVIFFPLQGFFNFLIFIRPRYAALRRQKHSRWSALKSAVWYPMSQAAVGSMVGAGNRMVNDGDDDNDDEDEKFAATASGSSDIPRTDECTKSAESLNVSAEAT